MSIENQGARAPRAEGWDHLPPPSELENRLFTIPEELLPRDPFWLRLEKNAGRVYKELLQAGVVAGAARTRIDLAILSGFTRRGDSDGAFLVYMNWFKAEAKERK